MKMSKDLKFSSLDKSNKITPFLPKVATVNIARVNFQTLEEVSPAKTREKKPVTYVESAENFIQ